MTTRRRALLLLLPAALLAPALLPGAGCRSAGEMTVAGARPEGCADCHQEVVAEWRSSAHASAWTALDAAAQADLACQGCHAPASVLPGGAAPAAREVAREAGVDCQACHLAPDGVLTGPLRTDDERLLAAHPARRDYFTYKASDLCGSCHRSTFGQWQAAPHVGVRPTCQECHMPPITRTRVQGGVAGALEPLARQRRHSFGVELAPGVDGEALTATLEATREGEAVLARASVTSRILHRLPSSEPGPVPSEWRLTLVARRGGGAEAGRVEEPLGGGPQGALLPGVARALQGRFPADTRRLELELRRERPRPRVVLRRELDLP